MHFCDFYVHHFTVLLLSSAIWTVLSDTHKRLITNQYNIQYIIKLYSAEARKVSNAL